MLVFFFPSSFLATLFFFYYKQDSISSDVWKVDFIPGLHVDVTGLYNHLCKVITMVSGQLLKNRSSSCQRDGNNLHVYLFILRSKHNPKKKILGNQLRSSRYHLFRDNLILVGEQQKEVGNIKKQKKYRVVAVLCFQHRELPWLPDKLTELNILNVHIQGCISIIQITCK